MNFLYKVVIGCVALQGAQSFGMDNDWVSLDPEVWFDQDIVTDSSETGCKKFLTAAELHSINPSVSKEAKQLLMKRSSDYLSVGRDFIVANKDNPYHPLDINSVRKLDSVIRQNPGARNDYVESLSFYDHLQTALALAHQYNDIWKQKSFNEKINLINLGKTAFCWDNVFYDPRSDRDFFNYLDVSGQWEIYRITMPRAEFEAMSRVREKSHE